MTRANAGGAKAMAARLIAAWRDGAPIEARPEDGPADLADAHAVQRIVAAALGPVGGFKTGRKTPEATPLVAPVRAAAVMASGTTPDPALSRLRGVELEIGFRLVADPPEADAPDFAARLAGRVVALPALEIVESRLADADAAGPLWKLADSQSNGAVILGAPVAGWRGIDLADTVARLAVAGETVWDGPAPTPGGCAFETFAAFARRLGGHCGGLRAGHVVITGSLTGLRFAPPGATVEGEIAGLGTVSARFA